MVGHSRFQQHSLFLFKHILAVYIDRILILAHMSFAHKVSKLKGQFLIRSHISQLKISIYNTTNYKWMSGNNEDNSSEKQKANHFYTGLTL